MIVNEELKILADDEGMKSFLVNNVEFLDGVVLPRIMNVKLSNELSRRAAGRVE